MKLLLNIKNLIHGWNSFVKRQLRRVGIFSRLICSFLLLLVAAALFLTFFFFQQYAAEIDQNLDRYTSLLVQNVNLKIQDTMQEYEDLALGFYDDSRVLAAIEENTRILQAQENEPEDSARLKRLEENTYLIENKLYTMRHNQKYIVNLQFVTPTRQYHMVEQNGFQRGGTIRNLEQFYNSEFYLLPQEKKGYPVWMDSREQSSIFYKNEQNFYGLGNIITLGIGVYQPVTRNFLGVLLLNIDLNVFSQALKDYDTYEEGNTFLIGQDGVLSWSSPTIQAPSFPQDANLYSQMLSHNQAVIRPCIDGEDILLSYERVPGTQIFSCYIASLDLLMARAYQIRRLCLMVLACIVLVCLLLSWYVTASIAEPIRRLIQVMQKTGKGKWTARYKNSGHDEITILGDCFNEMAENISQLMEQVYLSEIQRQQTLLCWKNAQLDALLMQINPHFLYNTLDIIRWEAMYEANGESRVTQMIEKFSQLCRIGMRTGGNTIPLQESIEHASTYMEVINFRHSTKIQLNINTQVDAHALYIPQFMLQPILENAVVHAFDGGSKGYCISISSAKKGQFLEILVEDNGKGMEPEELSRLRSSLSQMETADTSIGLVNVNQRIRLFYGNNYGIQVESQAGTGTQVKILLPLRHYSENMAIANTAGGVPTL